ncbi:MAG: hypothetical protein NTV54_07295 [Ignavibacteriales bacterium]|nr:hypothetical protein [Ignavibacteriales bacterium]
MTVLLVIAVIVLFLSIDWFAQPKKLRLKFAPKIVGTIAPSVRTPAGLFFSKSHTWMNVFPSGKLRMGIDDFIGNLMKQPEVAFLKSAGDDVKKGEPIMTLTEGNRSLTVRSPLDATILSVNQSLTQRPELMRDSLFSEGWAMTVQPKRFAEVKRFMLGEEAQAWIPGEFQRLRDVLAGVGSPALATMQDGGMPISGVLAELSEEACKQIDQEFMQVS